MTDITQIAKMTEQHAKWVNIMDAKISLLEKYAHIAELKLALRMIAEEYKNTVDDISMLEMIYVLTHHDEHQTTKFIGGRIDRNKLEQGMQDVSNYYGSRFGLRRIPA